VQQALQVCKGGHRFGGRGEFDEFNVVARKLDAGDRAELLDLLSSADPKDFPKLRSHTTNSRIRSVLPFYMPKPKDELTEIWKRQRALTVGERSADASLPDDERVEDAGLEYDDSEAPAEQTKVPAPRVRKVAA
jgi:hypothetical protein